MDDLLLQRHARRNVETDRLVFDDTTASLLTIRYALPGY